ncbi:MAG: hypothetical protein HKN25_11070 [Pyrinomonadaceae bacterium]|nr:hypothetical protein [Pyrinomonadaceae bacterium]
MKILLGIVAFTLTFGLSSTLVGLLFGFPQAEVESSKYRVRHQSSATTYKIKRLLKRDIANGIPRHVEARRVFQTERNISSLDKSPAYRSAVIRYVEKSSNLSDAGLPRDFQYAWRKHMSAWKNRAIYLKSFDNLSNPNSSTMNLSDDSGEINETWDQVLRIAERYGLEIDGSYYR